MSADELLADGIYARIDELPRDLLRDIVNGRVTEGVTVTRNPVRHTYFIQIYDDGVPHEVPAQIVEELRDE